MIRYFISHDDEILTIISLIIEQNSLSEESKSQLKMRLKSCIQRNSILYKQFTLFMFYNSNFYSDIDSIKNAFIKEKVSKLKHLLIEEKQNILDFKKLSDTLKITIESLNLIYNMVQDFDF